MANDLNRSIKIYIDGSEAQQGIAKVEAAVQKLEAKLASLNKGEADYEAKSKELQKELNAKTRTLDTYRKKVEETDRVLKNLSGATYQELLAVQKQVRKDLQNAVPGTEKYNAALEQNRRVSLQVAAAQKAMRVEVGSQGNMWLRASSFINQYIGIIGTVIAAVTGLTLKLNQLREARNKREEAKADVQALTGLDEESIAWLEQQAQRLSTSMDENGIRIRQSATEILDAYKLVGSAKPELLQDKEALNDVTKQTLILAQASGMTLKDAVDAVTLSLNQFGEGADQAARYANVMAAGSKYGSAAVESVTKALRNSGVAAASANTSIEQTVGMIETLAEKGIKDEVAGTGLKKFFLTLQTGADETNPKIVGLETALDNLAAKQLNAAKIKEMFGEEGYNVASVLINETEKVKYYTQAVTGTGVAIEQAGIKSGTAAAKLDQAKNKMQEMGIALMEKLNPGLVSAANGIVNWTQKGIKLVGFIVQHIGVITTLTASIAAYYAGVKIAALWETKLKDAKLLDIAASKLQNSWNKTLRSSTLLLAAAKNLLAGRISYATKAWKLFSTSIKANPLGLLLSLLTTTAGAIYLFATRNSEATKSLVAMNGELISEQHSLDSLFGALKRTAVGSQQRRDIIQQINDKYGTYLPNLLTEKSNLDEINEAYKRINRTLVTQLAMKYKNEEIGNITSEAAKTQVEVIEGMRQDLVKSLGSNELATVAINEVKQITNEFYSAGVKWEKAFGQAWHTIKAKYLGKNSIAKGFSEDMADYIQSVYDMNRKLAKVENKYASWMPGKPANELPEVTVTGNAPKKSGASSVDETEAEKQRRAALEREKILYEQAQAEITRIYAEGKDAELQTEQQYNDRLLAEKKKYLQRVMEVSGSGTKEAADAEKQLADIQLQERQDAIKRAVEKENDLYADQQRQLKEAYASGNDENLDSYQQYTEALEQLEMVHLQRMLEIAGLDAEARKQIEDKLLEYKIKCLKEYEDEQNKRSKKEKTSTQRDSRTMEQEYQQRFSRMKGYADEFGNALGEVISGQKSAMEALGDATIDIIYNVLNQMINAWLTQLAAKAAAATAEGSMTEIGTKGVAGIATSAVIAATVSGLLAAARTALKGLIGNRDGGSSSSSGDSGATYQRVASVNQYASGRYDVMGASDGRTYSGVPYIGPAPTGIVNSPALISERGAELIVNADDLRRLQKHINYPLVVQAINESRGRVTQYAQGNYRIPNTPTPTRPTPVPSGMNDGLIERLAVAIENLERNGVSASVALTELERKQKLRERSRKLGSK